MAGDEEPNRTVRKLLDTFASMYDLMATAPMFFDNPTLFEFRELVNDVGIALQYLKAWAAEQNMLMWQIRPKAHKAMHLPMIASLINPRSVSNYANESQTGTSTRVWKGSVSGRYKAHIQRTVLAKRWLAVLLRFERGM